MVKRAPATSWHPCPRSWHGIRSTVRRNVIHTIQGTADSALSWFNSANNPYGTGAHFVYDTQRAYQTADINVLLWHARNANADGVGHEIGGFAERSRGWWLSKAQRKKLRMVANRVAWVCYTNQLGSPRHGRNVFGHGEIPGNPDRTDPGKGFPWKFFMWLCRRAYRRLQATNGRKWQ